MVNNSHNSKDLNNLKNNNLMIIGSKLSENFVWILLIIIGIASGLLSDTFFTTINIMNIVQQSNILGILVIALSIVLLTGNFDLSIQANMVFTAIFAGWLVSPHELASGLQLNSALGVVLMLILGGMVGAFNGLMIGYFNMNAFMCTLSVSIILDGLNLLWVGGKQIFPYPDSFRFFGDGKIGPVPFAMISLILLYIIFHIFLTRTPFGRSLYAVGGNRLATRAAGIDDRKIIFLAYTLCGVMCGVAGWSLAGRLNSSGPNMASGMIFYVFAAAVIGGISLNGGKGTMFGAFGGLLLLTVIRNILNLVNVSPYVIGLMSGLIIFIAIAIDTIKNRYAKTL